MKRICLLGLFAMAVTAGYSDAAGRGLFGRRSCSGGNCSAPPAAAAPSCCGGATQSIPLPMPAAAPPLVARTTTTTTTSTKTVTTNTALDEVNALRAQRGLRPYLHDPALEQAAAACSAHRAANRIEGHSANDFAFLPRGARAAATGCAAWHPLMGWGSCAMYDSYTYAGAAFTFGADGRRYMHLFVR